MSDFTAAARLIERGIASHAFPAAAIEVGCRDRVRWRQAFGRLTYAAEAPLATDDTLFDLASLTKVIATTTLVMRAVDAGTLLLADRVADRLPAWRGTDREHVTIADLLEHASGLTAFLPFFRDHHGRADFERTICTLPLEYAPRTQSIYSDLGFMLLAFILEDVNRAPFARQLVGAVREPPIAMRRTGGPRQTGGSRAAPTLLLFNPPKELRPRCAPTELDLWRGRLLQGEVHDENTWELGGAAGHAGLFGTAAGVGSFARTILHGLVEAPGTREREAGRGKPEAGRGKREAESGKPEAGRGKRDPGSGRRWRGSSESRQSREARARSGGTRCCPPRRAARACRRARSATPGSPAHRCGSIPRRIFMWSCSPTACTRRATTTRSSRCAVPCTMQSSTSCRVSCRGAS